MKNKTFVLLVCLFLVMFSVHVIADTATHEGTVKEGADDYKKLFIVDLSFREDVVAPLNNPKIIYSPSPDYLVRHVVDHLTIEVVSTEGVVLTSFTIANPRILRIRDFGEEESSIVEADSFEDKLAVPFYKEAKSIRIYDPSGALLGEIPVADTIKEFCDGLRNNTCDPDCEASEGVDCKKIVFGESAIINWGASTPVVVDNIASDAGKIRIEIQGKTEKSLIEITPDKENKKIRISENKHYADTEEDVKIIGSQLYIADKHISITPDTAAAIAEEKAQISAGGSELGVYNERPRYTVNGSKKVKVLGFIPATMNIKTGVDAQDGEILGMDKPWWSFMATEEGEAKTS